MIRRDGARNIATILIHSDLTSAQAAAAIQHIQREFRRLYPYEPLSMNPDEHAKDLLQIELAPLSAFAVNERSRKLLAIVDKRAL